MIPESTSVLLSKKDRGEKLGDSALLARDEGGCDKVAEVNKII